MNNKTILGFSIGAIFAMSIIMSPAIAEHLDGHITDATLKDHAEGKNPANNPAHYELIVNATGNYTQYAIDATAGGVNATGFGIVNQTAYVWAFASHEFDDCDDPEDCGNYLPHGHKGQLILSDNCTDEGAFELVDVMDLGEAKVKVADDQSHSIIELDDIPADAELNLQNNICDIDEVADVADVTAFTISINATGSDALCVSVDEERSLETVAGADGPNHKDNPKPNGKNKNWPTRDGGFNSTETEEAGYCPT